MKYFVLTYDRLKGRLTQQTEFSEREPAMRALFEREMPLKGRSDVEVVLLSAPSIDAIKRTHARYFKSLSELMTEGQTSVS